MFGMFENPKFRPDAGEPPPVAACAGLASDWRAGTDRMSEVSMSWWLSQSVQAELDSQICDLRNRQTFADLMQRLSQHCPFKPHDPASGEAGAGAARRIVAPVYRVRSGLLSRRARPC